MFRGSRLSVFSLNSNLKVISNFVTTLIIVTLNSTRHLYAENHCTNLCYWSRHCRRQERDSSSQGTENYNYIKMGK